MTHGLVAQVENGKPAPDCFTAAAERLGVPPANCLVIEDAPSGVEAATAAGMRVVLVPSIPKTEYPAPDPHAAAGARLSCSFRMLGASPLTWV